MIRERLPAILQISLAVALMLTIGLVMGTPVAAANGPPVETGRVLHLDADAITGLNDDDPVETWDDLSGQGNHATQATEANRPTYKTSVLDGKPVVRFDGGNDYLTAPHGVIAGISNEITIFFVSKTSNIQNSSVLATYDPNDAAEQGVNRIGMHLPWADNNKYWDFGAWNDDGRLSTSWNANTNDFFLWTFLAETNFMEIRRDGDSKASQSVSSTFAPEAPDLELFIGRQEPGNEFDGDIAEILIYDRALTTQERADVEWYLGEKWLAWERPDEVWVCDDHGDDGDPGTFADPFKTIQHGITVVAADGTVNVKAGTYTENITVTKSITLVAPEGAKIEGTDDEPVVTIEDYTVTIEGFEIDPGTHGIYIESISAGEVITLTDLEIHGNTSEGINVGTIEGTLNIEGAVIYDNGRSGIFITEKVLGVLNIIDSIIAENDWMGIRIRAIDEGGIVLIEGNTIGLIDDGTWDFAGNGRHGVLIVDVLDNGYVNIRDNIIKANIWHGMSVRNVKDNSTAIIEDNIVNQNSQEGIHSFEVSEDSTLTIVGNDINENGWGGMYIRRASSNGTVTIEDNDINENGSRGIRIRDVLSGGTLTIVDNEINDNGTGGIYFHYHVSDNSSVIIEGNTITDNGDRGIQMDGDIEQASSYIVKGNTITGNSGAGIYISDVIDSTLIVEDNIIAENGSGDPATGISINIISGEVSIAGNTIGAWEDSYGATYLGNLGAGIWISGVSPGAALTIGPDNCIEGNSSHGIHMLWGSADASIEIHNNRVHQNGPSICGSGIKLGSSGVCGALVRNNTITNNYKGIYLDADSTQNIIRDNEIRENAHGIWIEGDNNQIIRNDILNNVAAPESGVHLTSTAEGNLIHCNNIVGNQPYGVYNENSEDTVDATQNWWGHASGPSGEGDGSGDAVSEYVDYSSWLPAQFQDCPECLDTPPIPPVGGTAQAADKLALLAPWLVLGAAIIAGAAIVVRRRLTQS